MKSLAWALVLPIMSEAANYSAKKAVADGIEIVRLARSRTCDRSLDRALRRKHRLLR